MRKRPSLYPDILFHFNTHDALCKILEETFTISYAKEKIVGKGKSCQFAIPMVSFCDLKLSELKAHMDKYGKYGIGLTKDWANRKGLNPVFYINKHSPLTREFISAVENLYKHLDTIDDNDQYNLANDSYLNILNLYRYIKNYEGTLIRSNGKTSKNYRFADEREWRYVPAHSEIEFPFAPLRLIETPEQKAALNQKISHLKLHFEPEDIRYLIIERDEERSELIGHLEKVKQGFDDNIRRRLASRILTSDQIENDI